MARKTTRKTRSLAAQKAVVTTRARREFRQRNEMAYEVTRLTAQGWTTQEIADELFLTGASVSAYRANASRGSYDFYLSRCNF